MELFEKMYLYQRIVRAKIFIDQHFAEAIDLDNIADQAHFSKFHFIRLFKSIYRRTPNNYLIKVRVEKAKDLLTEGHSITDTSFGVGFDSPTTFAALFKRITGQAPSTFRKAQVERSTAIMDNPLAFVPNCFAESYGWRK